MGIGTDLANAGLGLIQGAQGTLQDGLQNVNPDDPASLIQLQLFAFIFQNTVQSVSGTLQSVSSASSSSAQKIGQ